jgi:hypothetical protein
MEEELLPRSEKYKTTPPLSMHEYAAKIEARRLEKLETLRTISGPIAANTELRRRAG